MCDVCHGKSEVGYTTGNSPVLFCKKCEMVICYSCTQDLALTCFTDHPNDTYRLRLICDKCDYSTPYHVEKRRDPTDATFKTRDKFPPEITDEIWLSYEQFIPNAREFYGCRKCNYDVCSRCCANKLETKNTSASVVVRGSRVHILSFRVDCTRRDAPLNQLVNQARIAIPAVLNFLYLKRSTKRACLYFGRYDECGKTVGVSAHRSHNTIDSAEVLRSEFLKIMMHEIWPPLRVDSPSPDKPLGFVLQSDMQALLWIKTVGPGRCYVKLILQNIPYLYFDNVCSGQDKYRWKNRQLHVRRLDNLETEKAVESYEVYFRSLQNSCLWAREYYKKLGPHCVLGKVKDEKGTRTYSFAERLYDEEDSSLDYKSYWVDPLGELLSHVPQFMAGFANAYGDGKLLVGVMEVHKRELMTVKRKPAGKWWRAYTSDTYVPSKWIDGPSRDGRVALVLGLSLSHREIAAFIKGITQSFKGCIPPIPPEWITIKRHPVKSPATWESPDGKGVGIFLYSALSLRSERVIAMHRSKAHRALRTLLPYGLALVQIHNKSLQRECLPEKVLKEADGIIQYVVVRGDSNQGGPRCYAASMMGEGTIGTWEKPEWRSKLEEVSGEGYLVVDLEKPPALPDLFVCEVAVNRNDSVLPRPPGDDVKRPLFFTGWPSIPMWDEVNDVVIKIPKDLKLLDRKRMKKMSKHWFSDPVVLQRVTTALAPATKHASLSAETRGDWLPLIKLRLVCKALSTAVDATLGLSVFDSIAAEPILEPYKAPIPSSLYHHYTPPPILQMFYSKLGDVPMPFPYTLETPSRSAKPFLIHHLSRKPVLVAPLLRTHMVSGLGTYLAVVVCVETSKLLLVDAVCSKLLGVTDVFIEPIGTQRARHFNGTRMVGGISLQSDIETEAENTSSKVWDLPLFTTWYLSLLRDPYLSLTYIDNGFAIDPTSKSEPYRTSIRTLPKLCPSHLPPNVDGIQTATEANCDWHHVESKWMRNKSKHWRE
eukprot:TRINITY_DN14394_c0_g1_i1.p1 TRINITY_DN14394_c0_g1~~TRINITY_DN14394_c0_g1_i1.p1  ORF type:complete len:1099 (+),score=253.14 TRINITY_DN14394_c0_g1_i1:330-3299(+)